MAILRESSQIMNLDTYLFLLLSLAYDAVRKRPIEKIRENDWSLAARRYKPVTTEAVNHDAPAMILHEVLKLEDEIIRRGNALIAQVKEKQ